MHDEFLAVFVACFGIPCVAIWWAAHRHHYPAMSITEATRLAFKNYHKRSKRGDHK